ncbi:MAG: 4-fold beta flower protein [Clostridium sp.]
MVFYNQRGRAICYTEDNEHIFLFSGEPVAYINGNSVYGFNGEHLGWFENGWILDHVCYYKYFSEIATGGPVKPVKHVKPVKCVKRVRPVKCVKRVRPVKCVKHLRWSSEIFWG